MKLKDLLEMEGSAFESLKTFLNDVMFVANQSQSSHWNMRSPSFVALHPFFGDLYNAMIGHADAIAEQIRILDIEEMVSVSHRDTLQTFDEVENLEAVEEALEAAAISGEAASDGYGDATKNVIDGIVGDLQKWKWKINSSKTAGGFVAPEETGEEGEEEFEPAPEVGGEEEENL